MTIVRQWKVERSAVDLPGRQGVLKFEKVERAARAGAVHYNVVIGVRRMYVVLWMMIEHRSYIVYGHVWWVYVKRACQSVQVVIGMSRTLRSEIWSSGGRKHR